MLDEKEILPFNFFTYGGVYSGEHNGMRYLIKREGDKPDFILTATVWQGPYCYDAVSEANKTRCEFEYSEDGRILAIEWLEKQYSDRKEEWDNRPAILDAQITLNYEQKASTDK